jgi:glutamate-1-semialdehyde aminotransferase/spore coat polysaccharide biosynthesis protein SpsF (cytidylyltransferase family)
MKVVAIAQARMGSTRLPGKVLKLIQGRPTISWVVEAARRSSLVDEVVVATTTNPSDAAIVDWCVNNSVTFYRGSETDVISRYMEAARGAGIIVRLTCDCPFLDSRVIDEVIQLRQMKGAAYATNTDPPTYPDGLDVEVFTREALEAAHSEATRSSDRDTVTRFMVRNRQRFSATNLTCPLPGLVAERWVLDSPEDYDFIQEVAKRLTGLPNYLDILKILDKEPDLRKINNHLTRNERFYDGMLADMDHKRTYSASKTMLEKAEKLIPLGAQTFSKSKLMFPAGVTPLFLTHGDGGYCYDVDGNDYIDLVGGLLPNILGYRDPDVDGAIHDQLSRGISFSLATPLETTLAEKLNTHIPSAEMVRFGKNGSDVTTAAIRLARHITGRDKVVVGGYHGWHDWSMSVTERDAGIPLHVQDLSYRFIDDIRDQNTIAAYILEPEFFKKDELEAIRERCTKNGTVLIFDEIITGFRCGMGGLQKVHGVTPDLSTFGKAMANGMPISALVGKREFMSRMPEISYSGTFFGEALSIAASIATIDKLYYHRVPEQLEMMGEYLRSRINPKIRGYDMIGRISLHGPVELNRTKFSDKETQSIFIQEMAKNGVLIIGSHNTCYAHKKPEWEKILQAWDKTLYAMSKGQKLEGEIIQGRAVR